jgi:hypothetical protein
LSHRAFDLQLCRGDRPVDIMVAIVDHFEPVYQPTANAAAQSVQAWCEAYEGIASRHRDADGRPPQHSWFFPAEYPNPECLKPLSASAFRGFGEVEFHLHHGFDTHESFAAKLRAGLEWLNRHGAMLTAEPQPLQRFAYIAGNWALDNGASDRALSGCESELLALRENGCYADFTFPALGSRAQPRKTNAIYYARHEPGPKSYDSGHDLVVNGSACGDLLIFQGPLVVNWKTGKFEDGGLENWAPPSPDRLDLWLRANVHVQGRPEWIFVKLYTHAVQSSAAFLGPGLDALFEAMDTRWNQPPFRLHYVTAREAYNIAKAAEAGHDGNPGDFRDFVMPPPANRHICCSGPWRLLSYSPDHLSVRFPEAGPMRLDCDLGLRVSAPDSLQRFDAWFQAGRLSALQFEGEGAFEVTSGGITRHFASDTLSRLRATWTDAKPSSPQPLEVSERLVASPAEVVTR